MPALSKESYTFDPRPNYPFLISANRYFLPSSPHLNDDEALTLICTHGTGFHKEQWEPTLEHLFALVGDQVKIREVWSIDAPNHGDSAVLNEHTLQWGYEPTCKSISGLLLILTISAIDMLFHHSQLGRICPLSPPLPILSRHRC